MKNNLEEDYCSFEVSKLLKEKGFDIDWRNCRSFGYYPNHGDGAGWYEGCEECCTDCIKQPTHALAIKWIRENFGFHIATSERGDRKGWGSVIENTKNNPNADYATFPDFVDHITPEASTEAALLYTLKHLI